MIALSHVNLLKVFDRFRSQFYIIFLRLCNGVSIRDKGLRLVALLISMKATQSIIINRSIAQLLVIILLSGGKW